MTGEPKNTGATHTGGRAYIGGNVNTGGGDFVGRDQQKIQGGVSLEEFRTLVADIGRQLHQQQVNLPPDVATVIEGDFQVVEQQANQESPNGTIIKSKLNSMLDLLKNTGDTVGALDNIMSLAGKAALLAGHLFT